MKSHVSKAVFFFIVLASCLHAFPTSINSSGPIYTVDFNGSGQIYAIDPKTGGVSIVATIPGNLALGAIALADSHTAYVTGQYDGNIYAVNLATGALKKITQTPLPPPGNPFGIALKDKTTAYVATYRPEIYSVNLQTGEFSKIAEVGIATISDITLVNDATAYVLDSNNNYIYSLDLSTGRSTLISTVSSSPDSNLNNIALANNSAIFGSGYFDNKVYSVDLSTGDSSLVTPIALGPSSGPPELDGLAVANNSKLYTVGDLDNRVYAINPNTGVVTLLTTVPFPDISLSYTALLLQMNQIGLSGNSLRLAKYLNDNTPPNVIRAFALLPSGLDDALKSASPARNAFSTFAAQNAYLASSQTLADHLRSKRFHHQEIQDLNSPDIEATFIADASNRAIKTLQCQNAPYYSLWFVPFGEIAYQKAQHGTPAFQLGTVGGLLAAEYTCESAIFGLGGTYVYSNVSEKKEGNANVNQGFLTAYTTLHNHNLYTDIGLWGGYYSSNNVRNIAFPGVYTKAKSVIQGWQTAAHLEFGYNSFGESNDTQWFGFEPFFMGDWVGNWEQGFHERGAGIFNMGQKGRFCSLLRQENGVRFYEILQFKEGTHLVFWEKTSYVYQKAFKTGHITAFLIGSPGTFTVASLTGAQNLGVFEFAMLYHPAGTTSFDFRIQSELGSNYWSNQGMFEISHDF